MDRAGPPSRWSDSTRQELSATTCRPMRRASPISDSVPCRPPTAITTSAAVTTTKLRTTPRPVAMGVRTNSFAARGIGARQDADRLAARSGRTARCGQHHATEAPGHDDGTAAGEVRADLLGPLEQPVRIGPARLAVADDSHDEGALPRGQVRHVSEFPDGVLRDDLVIEPARARDGCA